MAKFLWLCIVLLAVNTRLLCDAAEEERKVYIVYMGAQRNEDKYSLSALHANMLQEVVDGSFVSQSLVRSYTRSFNAFAAKLTDHERQQIAGRDGVVSVFPSRTLQPQTTRSWDFMGFSENISQIPKFESDVVVGVIDTGIWPESRSFSDEGFGPPPKKWKGECNGGRNFTCNKKIIGARYYNSESTNDASARDIIGHGTHTASTAAGNIVKNASFFGVAQGNARGGVPSARIAAYKVCHPNQGCPESDLLAAFDDAIADGVDIITISIGGATAAELVDDTIAIGAFHAMEKGILTVNSAGNNGFQPGTVSSVAPWMLSVAASTTDRRIVNKVVLGNGKVLLGNTVDAFSLKGTKFPLITGSAASTQCESFSAQECNDGCLDTELVKGKIVVCTRARGIQEALRAGALGAICPRGDAYDISPVVPFPAAILNPTDMDLIQSYIKSERTSQANILKSEELKILDAPVVATFSSKGPNAIIPDILKPDITAPGVNILAAYSEAVTPTGNPLDKRSAQYNIVSGTSMACPHVAGAAAYVKAVHPEWSPSAIKSALMTTAWRMNGTRNPLAEFAYGSGHLDPVRAADPGLVYETSRDDYVKMLCGMNYDRSALANIIGGNFSCPQGVKGDARDVNYPSMASLVKADTAFTVKFQRRVTNVGSSSSTYKAEIIIFSRSLKVTVEPRVLSFKKLGESQSFVVTVSGSGVDSMKTASLIWSDGSHRVRSPIVLYTA